MSTDRVASQYSQRYYLHQRLLVLDLEELRTLCFYLEVDYDNLRGEGKSAKARELIRGLERQNRVHEIESYLKLYPWNQPRSCQNEAQQFAESAMP